MTKLDAEEQELLASIEKDEWHSVDSLDAEKRRYQGYAKGAFKKDQRIHIRLSGKDLQALKTLALEEGIPYQTLISSILHKYASGRLTEKPR